MLSAFCETGRFLYAFHTLKFMKSKYIGKLSTPCHDKDLSQPIEESYAFLVWFRDRKRIQRDSCAQISMNSSSPGPHSAHTTLSWSTIPGLTTSIKHRTTLCCPWWHLTYEALWSYSFFIESEFLSVQIRSTYRGHHIDVSFLHFPAWRDLRHSTRPCGLRHTLTGWTRSRVLWGRIFAVAFLNRE